MALETFPWDPLRYLQTAEDQDAYVLTAFESGDRFDIFDALKLVAEARSEGEVAKEAAQTRDANPDDGDMTVALRLARALGYRLTPVRQVAEAA